MLQPEAAFRTYIDRILGSEGGYVNDPRDPGGETNWGIAKRFYPDLDIAHITRDQAIEIYYRDFWARLGGGSALANALVFQLLDAGVNHGIGNAVRMLQRAVGVLDDGNIGALTLAAIVLLPVDKVIMRFNAERVDFYTKLAGWDTFGRGWARRVALNLRYAAEEQ